MKKISEKLHESITFELNQEETEILNLKAKKEAAMLSLYFTVDAKISSQYKFEIEKQRWVEQNLLSAEAIKMQSKSSRVLHTANEEKLIVEIGVTKGAQLANSIKVAVNKIVESASVMGMVFSTVSANNFDSTFFNESKYSNELMKKTAYNGEKLNLAAMRASANIAAVSSKAVYDRANTTFTAFQVISDKLKADLKSSYQRLENCGIDVDFSTKEVTRVENILENINAEYKSKVQSYISIQNEFNLGLHVIHNNISQTSLDDTILNNHGYDSTLKQSEFAVCFKPFLSPFGSVKTDMSLEESIDDKSYQPVQSYRVFIVEDNLKSVFTESAAVAIEKFTELYKEVLPASDPKDIMTQVFDLKSRGMIKDTSGNDIVYGKNYVVFVQAILKLEYKKTIDVYDDYLSAPSSIFALNTLLGSGAELHQENDSQNLTNNKDTGQDPNSTVAIIESKRIEVSNAERQIGILQVSFDALTAKLAKIDIDLTQANAALGIAARNQKELHEILNTIRALILTSETATAEMASAKNDSTIVASQIGNVIKELIYASECVEKLIKYAIRIKAINPLVPDEIITQLQNMDVELNNALELLLIDLKSSIELQSDSLKSHNISQLELEQAKLLLDGIIGKDGNTNNLQSLIKTEYDQSKINYENLKNAYAEVEDHLSEATIILNKEKVKFKSLKASLEALLAANKTA